MPPKGKCEKCGQIYCGWSLKEKEQLCDCGGKIILIEENKK